MKITFFSDIPLSNSSQKIFSTVQLLKGFSTPPIETSKKASHTLLANHLMSDIVQSV